MLVAFDPDKDFANRAKHGLPLAFGEQILAGRATVVLPTFRQIDEEQRFKAIGPIDGKLYTVVHVWRGEVARLISVRRSNANEQRDYGRYAGRSR